MTEDDDIPVLTQILRTGGPREPGERIAASGVEPIEQAGSREFDVRPLDATLMGDALVIGNEPQGDKTAPHEHAVPFDDDDAHDLARYATSEEPGGDSFRLPQDHDQVAAADAGSTRFDEPAGDALDRPTVVAAGPHERRVNPFVTEEPRERRQEVGDVSLQRLASITSSVRDSVLVALQTRIDTELDARIAQAMHREVETAIAHLQDKLREGLTDALRDVVARAVDDEMTRFVAAERQATARLDPRKPPVRFDA